MFKKLLDVWMSKAAAQNNKKKPPSQLTVCVVLSAATQSKNAKEMGWDDKI